MHAIDTPGSINGRFDEGNPATGQRAARVGADWLNDTQENLLAVLAEAGVVPTKGRAADLVDAIKVIVRAAGGGSGGGGAGGVPNTRTVTGGGLLSGQGGDLSADRVFTLLRASPAEIRAGTDDSKVLTAKALFDAMTGGLGDRSVTIGPLTLKQGANLGSYVEGSYYTAFPQPFASACWGVIPVTRNDTGGNTRDTFAQLVGAPSKDGFTTYLQRGGGGNVATGIDGFEWIAIGL